MSRTRQSQQQEAGMQIPDMQPGNKVQAKSKDKSGSMKKKRK